MRSPFLTRTDTPTFASYFCGCCIVDSFLYRLLDQIPTRVYTNRKDKKTHGGRNQLLLISSSFPTPFDGLYPWGGNFPAAPCFLRNSSRAFSSAMISATSSAIVRPSLPLPCLSEPLPPSNTSRERPPTSEDPMTPRSSSKSMRRAARE